ncbi:DUF5009 domain-containing protein [Opitutales bacterium ASA1]|uniref:acyltransferase family protein n=1 Tax=Congregicoccus parvus TaxID=3081749 RepID=UPI002B2E1022|nr:DUF5009 domain-containing protein [Opitutales bacterium ASA1]
MSILAKTKDRAVVQGGRLMSLDALRGFDMLWIVGADEFGKAFRGMAAPGVEPGLLARQFSHAAWEGFTFYDLVFPLFLFMVGVSIVFSLGRVVAEGGRSAAIVRIVRRSVLLYVLGLIYYGGFVTTADGDFRWVGVLQRIAICYFAASLLFLAFRWRGLVVATVSLLLGYWALLTFVPVPEFGAGDFAEGRNLTNWFDREFLGGYRHHKTHDPEGLLSTLPAIASCLIGVLAGLWIRRPMASERARVSWMAGVGVVLVLLGFAWGSQFPVIKKIWTSSYVLVGGGYSLLALAVFYWIIDVRMWRAWAVPFVWVGTNALTIYLISRFVDFENLARRIAGGPIEEWLDERSQGLGYFCVVVLGVVLSVLLCRFLYRRQIFLRL